MAKKPRVRIFWRSCVTALAADVGLDSFSLSYVRQRLSCEGVTFLTKTLPKLAKSVLRSLELGFFERPTCFAWKGASLRYFTVWLNEIFDERGIVRKNPCPFALKSLRQFCEYFYKLTLPFSKKVERLSELNVLSIEDDLSSFSPDRTFLEECRKTFETLYPELCNEVVAGVLSQHRPRTSSGSFAGSNKSRIPFYLRRELPDNILGTTVERFRAFSGYFKPYPSSDTRIVFKGDTCDSSETLFVPKDSRGPRNISKEPLHLLKIQMAYFDYLSNYLERKSRGRINFSDQSINRRLARKGSVDKGVATLDLKEASDRVHLSVVRSIFRGSPFIRWFIENARSTHTKLPVSGGYLRLNKLAGMGSGLTFPTMALLIHVAICTSIRKRFSLTLNRVRGSVYVYGDDVIVPTCWYDVAVRGLQAVGLCVNNEKSYYRSSFRESCGGDFFNGVEIGPVRLKLSNNDQRSSRVSDYRKGMSLVGDMPLFQLDRHARELVKNQLVCTAEYFNGLLKDCFGDVYGTVSGDSPYMGIWTDKAWNKDTPEPRLLPVPITVYSSRNCPYKYLSRFFKYSEEDSWAGSYGSLASPRKIKLEVKLAHGVELR